MHVNDIKHKGESDFVLKICEKLSKFDSATDRIQIIFFDRGVANIKLTPKPTFFWERWLAKIYKPTNLRQREVAHFLASFFSQNLKALAPQHISLVFSLKYLWQKGAKTESDALHKFVLDHGKSLQEAAKITKTRDAILQEADKMRTTSKEASDKANATLKQANAIWDEMAERRKKCDEQCQKILKENEQLILERERNIKVREEYAQTIGKFADDRMNRAEEHLTRATKLDTNARNREAEVQKKETEVKQREVEVQKREQETKKREIAAKQREDQANGRLLQVDKEHAAIVKEGQDAAEKIKSEAEEVLKQAKIQAASAVVQRSKDKEIGAKLLQLAAHRDVVIKCAGSKGLDDKVVYAHSLVLQTHPGFSAKSTFEANLIYWSKICSERQAKDGAVSSAVTRAANNVFSIQAQEKLMPTTLDLSDYSEEAVQQLMNYWYTGKTDPIPPQIIIELYQLAEFLVLDELVEQCVSSFTKLVDEVPDLLSVLPTPRNIAHYSKLDARFCVAFIKHRAPGSLNAGQLKLFKEFIAPILVAQLERDKKLEFSDRERVSLIEGMETFWQRNELPHRKNLEDHARTIEVFIRPFLAQYNVSDTIFQQAMRGYLSSDECIPSRLPVRDKLALCQAAIDSNLIDSDFGYACLRSLRNNDELSPDTGINQLMEYFSLPKSDQNPVLTSLLFTQFYWFDSASDSKKQEFYKFLNSKHASPEIRYLFALCKTFGVGCAIDGDSAIKELKELCAEDCPFGLTTLGNIEELNTFPALVPRDCVRALAKHRKAANKGYIRAKGVVGLYYLLGQGTRVDIPLGLREMEWAAQRGYVYACCHLGEVYQKGNYGQSIDELKAFKFTRHAAEFGDASAMLPLSKFYETGYSGIPVNMELALKWATKANEFGVKEAAEEVERLMGGIIVT